MHRAAGLLRMEPVRMKRAKLREFTSGAKEDQQFKWGFEKVGRTRDSKTYYFSQGGGQHVSDRCQVWCRKHSASAEQGFCAVVGDKESSGCNQAEPQPFKAH